MPDSTTPPIVTPAADALWPWNDQAHRPIRKTFDLQPTRPMAI